MRNTEQYVTLQVLNEDYNNMQYVLGYMETNHAHSSRITTKINAINTRPEIQDKTMLPNIRYKIELAKGFLDIRMSCGITVTAN